MEIKIVSEELGHLLDGGPAHKVLVGGLALVNLAHLNLLEALACLLGELLILDSHAGWVAGIRILGKLFAREDPALW